MTLPDTMRALRVETLAENYAGCALRDIPVPQPGEGEILLKVHAGSFGFPDLLMTHGGYQHKPGLPFTPGGDVAGEVAAAGPGVDGFRAGDRVVTSGLGGALAEYGLYTAERVRAIPDHLGYAEAASVGSAYLTAYVALVRRAGPKSCSHPTQPPVPGESQRAGSRDNHPGTADETAWDRAASSEQGGLRLPTVMSR